MLTSPDQDQPSYGMITSGDSFMFIKLVKGTPPQYAVSKLFGIREPDDLATVFAVLKGLGTLVSESF